MGWPVSNRIEYTADRAAPRQRVKDLESRDITLLARPFRFNFDEQSSTVASPWDLALAREVYSPALFPSLDLSQPGQDPAQYRLGLEIELEAWVTGGSGELRLRREDATFPINGDAQTITATSPTPVTLQLRNVDFIGFIQNIWVQYYKVGGGTIFVRSTSATVDYARAYWFLEE